MPETEEIRKLKKSIRKKIYYAANKDIIAEKNRRTYICSCGSCVTILQNKRHDKTIKHNNYVFGLGLG